MNIFYISSHIAAILEMDDVVVVDNLFMLVYLYFISKPCPVYFDNIHFFYYLGHHWSLLCQHSSHCILQYWFASASCWSCYPMQQQGCSFNWFDVLDVGTWSVAHAWQYQPSDPMGCHAWFVLLQRSWRGKFV